MCGIAGFIDFRYSSSHDQLNSMVNSLHHRGPDDSGAKVFNTDNAQIGLGHARLSIIDLSEGGHQPMSRYRVHIVFNGEIYNYSEIREELKSRGYVFSSDSDTEVIIQSYSEWGIKCVDRFIGMFAFAIYDEERKEVFFCRDRAGVKPLLIYEIDGLVVFGSELKAVMSHSGFVKEIDKSVLPDYLSYGFIPAPKSIFKNTIKLLPGTYGVLDLESKSLRFERYWDIKPFYEAQRSSLLYEEAKETLHDLLRSAYNYRMVADVPVGVFLSGGYDSTSVAAILSQSNEKKIQTFTIGFHEGNNEAPQAKQIAKHLGTEHRELYCTQEDAKRVVQDLSSLYDEPFADSSAIPTILVSQMAREYVTVALSADGGDEVFFGYGDHFTQLHNLNRLAMYEKLGLGNSTFRKAINSIVDIAPLSPRQKYQAECAIKALGKRDMDRAAYLFTAAKRKPLDYLKDWLLSSEDNETNNQKDAINITDFTHPGDVFSFLDYSNYLPNDILTKVDRATMSTSLEGREPLLDHRVAEFAAGLPHSYKFDGVNNGKRILKDIVYDYVPKEIMDQPKRGFTIPVLSWLKGDLKHLLDKYLSIESLEKTNTFNPIKVELETQRFLRGELHYEPLIWYVLIYQMWYFEWMNY